MWVRSDGSLPTSRKMGALIRALAWGSRGVSGIDEAIGIVHRLWYAVMAERPEGVLEAWTPEDVAFKLGRDGSSHDSAQGRLGLGEHVAGMAVVDALLAAGFLAVNEDGVLFVPGWMDRNGHRAKDLQRYKASVPRGTAAESDGVRRNPPELRHTRRNDTRRTSTDAAAPRPVESAERPQAEPVGKSPVLRAGSTNDPSRVREDARAEIARLTRSLEPGRNAPAWADAVAQAGAEAGANPAQVKTAMQVCGRLARTGVTDARVLGGIAAHYFGNLGRVGNPFAYYTSGGSAVSVMRLVLSSRLAMAEHDAEKMATAIFLKGGAS